MSIQLLKDIREKIREQFNKEGLKTWNKNKTYNYAQVVASLDLAIKYYEKFEDDRK